MRRWPTGEFCTDPMTWYYLSRNRRLDWDAPSACIVGHDRSVPLHPESPSLRKLGPDKWRFAAKGKVRRLSFTECAALQGFPREWRWRKGAIPTRYRLIGNAVPPPLFEAVIRALPPIWKRINERSTASSNHRRQG